MFEVKQIILWRVQKHSWPNAVVHLPSHMLNNLEYANV